MGRPRHEERRMRLKTYLTYVNKVSSVDVSRSLRTVHRIVWEIPTAENDFVNGSKRRWALVLPTACARAIKRQMVIRLCAYVITNWVQSQCDTRLTSTAERRSNLFFFSFWILYPVRHVHTQTRVRTALCFGLVPLTRGPWPRIRPRIPAKNNYYLTAHRDYLGNWKTRVRIEVTSSNPVRYVGDRSHMDVTQTVTSMQYVGSKCQFTTIARL